MKKLILMLVACFAMFFGGCGDADVSSNTEYHDAGTTNNTEDAGPQSTIVVSWAGFPTRYFCRDAEYIYFYYVSSDNRVQYQTTRPCETVTQNGLIGSDRVNGITFIIPSVSISGQVSVRWANGNKVEFIRNNYNRVVVISIP